MAPRGPRPTRQRHDARLLCEERDPLSGEQLAGQIPRLLAFDVAELPRSGGEPVDSTDQCLRRPGAPSCLPRLRMDPDMSPLDSMDAGLDGRWTRWTLGLPVTVAAPRHLTGRSRSTLRSGPEARSMLVDSPALRDRSYPENDARLEPPTPSELLATKPGSRSSSWRLPSAFATPPSPPRPSVRAPWPTWTAYLAADGIGLSDDVLDRIDEIAPPAVTVNVTDEHVGRRPEGAGCLVSSPVDQPGRARTRQAGRRACGDLRASEPEGRPLTG